MTEEIKRQLWEWAAAYHCAGFIQNDPVQFPHRYERKQDIEISGLLTAIMSFGNRKPVSYTHLTPWLWAMRANFSISSTSSVGLEMVSPNRALVLGRKAAEISFSLASGLTKVTSMPNFFKVTPKRLNVPP